MEKVVVLFAPKVSLMKPRGCLPVRDLVKYTCQDTIQDMTALLLLQALVPACGPCASKGRCGSSYLPQRCEIKHSLTSQSL